MADGNAVPTTEKFFMRASPVAAAPLKPWHGPTHLNYAFLVRINVCDKISPRIDMFEPYRMASPTPQSGITKSLIDEIAGVSNSSADTNYDFECNISSHAFIIFEIVDKNARFREADTKGGRAIGIMEEFGAVGRLLYSSEWVQGYPNFCAFSVVLSGVVTGANAEQIYGLAVDFLQPDGSYKPDVIDPKVENDGDGGAGVPTTP
ncbi:MAG: hypothetical protein WC729_10430 [Sphingomonas sp.]|uniref:hypothetical protein n=1 Tax=Sphingomonas sp. TaxID=28214 RepID=UPI003568FACC